MALEIHDLLVSKYAAGREKDHRFARVAFRHRLAQPSTVVERLALAPLSPERRALAVAAVLADAKGESPAPA